MSVRRRPSAEQIAMGTAALWLAVFAVIDAMPPLSMISLFAVAPLIVATAADERFTAIFSGAAVALALTVVMWDDVRRDENYWVRVAAIGITGVMAVVLAGLRRRREERLIRMSAIAQASQLALLPSLPPEMTGINIAARFRSATRDAAVGGDLYEIIPTRHGIRVIIGDVRGKGLDAIMLARHVLSAFRRSAVARSALEQVAGEVSRVIKPHLGEEDFVTAALAEITPGGDLTIVNCGHHPPLLRHRGGLESLTGGKADLPLGLDDNFAPFTARWSPGDRLLLYTDGLVESRDHHGDFLPEDEIAAALLATDCEQALDALMMAVHRFTRGHSHDDMALLLLENGVSPRSTANGRPVKATAQVVGPLWGLGGKPQWPRPGTARRRHRRLQPARIRPSVRPCGGDCGTSEPPIRLSWSPCQDMFTPVVLKEQRTARTGRGFSTQRRNSVTSRANSAWCCHRNPWAASG